MIPYTVGIAPWLLLGLAAVLLGWPWIRKLWADEPIPRDYASLLAEHGRLLDRLDEIAARGGDYMTAREMLRWDAIADRLAEVRERLAAISAQRGYGVRMSTRLGPPPWPRGR